MWSVTVLLVWGLLPYVDGAAVRSKDQRHKRNEGPLYYSATSGVIESPGYSSGDNYANNFEQYYIIKPTICLSSPCLLSVQCQYDIEEVHGCVYDRLVLVNDGTVLCGTNVYSAEGVEMVNGEFPMYFVSDVTETRRGFSIYYHAQQVEPTTTTAPPTTTYLVPDGRSLGYVTERWGDQGTFSSPNYPEHYPHNFEQEYVAHLDSPGSQTVRVEYDYDIEAETNCLFDHLTLGTTGQKLCGTSSGVVDVPVSGGTFRVFFSSDNSIAQKGFTLSYSVLPADLTFGSRLADVDLPSLITSPDAVTTPPPASDVTTRDVTTATATTSPAVDVITHNTATGPVTSAMSDVTTRVLVVTTTPIAATHASDVIAHEISTKPVTTSPAIDVTLSDLQSPALSADLSADPPAKEDPSFPTPDPDYFQNYADAALEEFESLLAELYAEQSAGPDSSGQDIPVDATLPSSYEGPGKGKGIGVAYSVQESKGKTSRIGGGTSKGRKSRD